MKSAALSTLVAEAKAALAGGENGSLSSAQRAAREISLAEFVKAMWPLLEPATPLIWSWTMQTVCDHVQALLEGRLACNNLIVNVPPGSAKSTIVSVAAPAWRWIREPTWRGIFASGNPAIVTRDSLRCRTVIESAWYRKSFGIAWTLAEDANEKRRYLNSATGFRVALSSMAKVTGDRATGIFCDDPLDADDAYSEAERTAVNNWWDVAYANRLNDLRTGTRCIIMQRLHTEDLAGHILKREPGSWELLRIPMVWEESQRITTSLGWTDPRTKDGELMDAVRFPQEIIDAEKLRLGESGFAGQHQQRPFAAGGEVFKEGSLQLWDAGAPLPHMQQIVISLDTAFKEGETADFSVGFVLAKFEGLQNGIFLLDRVRGRYSYPVLLAIVHELAARWRPSAVLIEDAASGQSLIQSLKASSALPVRPVRPDGDKLSRAHTVVPTWEAGRIFAPAQTSWLPEFLEELHAFPKAPHDDQVDAFVQGVRYLTSQHVHRYVLGSLPRSRPSHLL